MIFAALYVVFLCFLGFPLWVALGITTVLIGLTLMATEG